MKILHITAVHTMEAESGIPAVVKGLCEYQNKMDGVESRVLSLFAKVDNVGSQYFSYLGDGSFKRYIKDYMPDFVIFHDFYYLEYATMALRLKVMGIPYALEPHGAFGRQAIKKSRIKKFIANNTIFRILINGSVGFIYTNEGERNDSAYRKNKVVVIPNGVNTNAIDALDRKLYDPNLLPIFYFLGRFDINHKGLDFLFDALDVLDRKSKRIIIRLYGIGDDKETSFVNDRIGKLKIIDIENRGTIYGEDKIKALREANILLLTSRYEGSPMTILDALCYGNPCLLTPGTNVADEIVENGLGWKTELEANAIAESIEKAQDDYRKDYNVYYQRCQQYMKNNALWDIIAVNSIKEYKKLLG